MWGFAFPGDSGTDPPWITRVKLYLSPKKHMFLTLLNTRPGGNQFDEKLIHIPFSDTKSVLGIGLPIQYMSHWEDDSTILAQFALKMSD